MSDNQPTASGVSDEMVEAGAKFLAPVWPGGFEDQGNLPLTYAPNDFARKIARGVLEAALSAKPAQGGDYVLVPKELMQRIMRDLRWCTDEEDDYKHETILRDIEAALTTPPQPIPTPDEAREHLAFLLFQSDWPKKADLQWDGDGTKDHPGHAKLKDMAFNRYCTLADVSVAALSRARPEDVDSQDAAFILWFEDAGKEQILFSGFGAADAAHRAYAEAQNSWSCHLFKKVAPAGALKSAHSPAPRVDDAEAS